MTQLDQPTQKWPKRLTEVEAAIGDLQGREL